MDSYPEVSGTRRLQNIARFSLFWGVLILCRLIHLQVFCHDELRRLAQSQQENLQEIPAPRGLILDRTGQPLAITLHAPNVVVNPLRLKDVDTAGMLLASKLNLDEAQLIAALRDARTRRKGYLVIQRNVTPAVGAAVKSLRYDGIEVSEGDERVYPKGQVAAHVLGGVDFEGKGNAGIELSLEKELRGKPGTVRVVADVRRKGFDSEVVQKPQPGAALTLTIHSEIQHIAEQAIAKAVQGCATCKSGTVVLIDPRNGDVLALANYPTYNPNEPPQANDEGRKNRAVTAPFEPGSVYKVITLAAALDTRAVHANTMINCFGGSFRLPGRVLHDAHPHGVLDVGGVLRVSSNIGAAQIGMRTGADNLAKYSFGFGMGRKTGLGLPGEEPGLLRPASRWQPTSLASIAMGHEVMATSVQLAQAAGVIANGGARVKPRLVLRKQYANGRVEEIAPAAPEQVLKRETALTMRHMMEIVVNEGTGKRAKLNGYSAAGKTGTAQIYDAVHHVYTHSYNASFIGFAPVHNPAIAMAVTVIGATGTQGYGGTVSGPVFKEVATAALRILEVPRDLPEEDDSKRLAAAEPEPDSSVADLGLNSTVAAALAPAAQPAPNVDALGRLLVDVSGPVVPDFRGKSLRTVIQESAANGLEVELLGKGLARAQFPAPGTILPQGERIRVQFAR